LEPHEVVLSIASVQLATSSSTPSETSSTNGDPTASPPTKPYLLIGTAYALPDEDEPTRGRVLLLSCTEDDGISTRTVKNMAEMHVRGGVYSICQFYNGVVLLTVNSKTHVCQLTHDGGYRLSFLGVGHHGHILSLLVQSRAPKHVASHDDKSGLDDNSPVKKKPVKPVKTEQLAIVGDLMRSISLVQYYPEHKALEEVARDFNGNWTTAMEMLTENLYLGAENWSNLYVLRRNAKATSDEIRCRLETVGRFHLGEMCNTFVSGSLTMPQTQTSSGGSSIVTASTRRKGSVSPAKGLTEKTSMSRIRRPIVTIGSQTLFGTVDGTLGSILGLDARTAAFFTTLERAMAKTIQPVGDFSHQEFRAFDADSRVHPAHGFVDGDLIESFLDLDRVTMQAVVDVMNLDGGWEIENHSKKNDEEEEAGMNVENQNVLTVDDVLAMVEEMTMFH
jgi:DNA damage-binding protein 1